MNDYDVEKKDKINFDILLEAAHGAFRSVRAILVIMIIASVLAFSAFWNSLDISWAAKRMRSVSTISYNLERLQYEFKESLIKAVKEKKDPRSNQNSIGATTLNSLTIQDFKKDIALKEKFLLTDFIKQQKLDEQKIKEITFRRFDIEEVPEKGGIVKFDIFIGEENVETLRVELEELDLILIGCYKRLLLSGTKELRNFYLKLTENQGYLHFNIPFFNIDFDINDLGFIGGLAFVLILSTLYLSLLKEKENAEIAYKTSKTMFKKNYAQRYSFINFMSLNQILIIRTKGYAPLIRAIALIIFLCMPVFVSLLILVNDFTTLEIGKMLDPNGAFFFGNMVGRLLFFLIILLLTFLCYKKVKNIDKIWKAEVDEINKLKKPKSSE